MADGRARRSRDAGAGTDGARLGPALRRRPAPRAVTVHDLDGLDRRIVAALQTNGRNSNAAIARALGVTEATVRHRIERLIADRFLRITAIVDPRKTAYTVDVIIWMRLARGKALEVSHRLAAFPNVVYVGHTTGRFDLLVEALFESDEALFEFLTRELSETLGVVSSETAHVLRTVKINYDWQLFVGDEPAAGTPRADGGVPEGGTAGRRRNRVVAGTDAGRPARGSAPGLGGRNGRRPVERSRSRS